MRKYPAKILLFGEYTVLQGGKALAIPYENFAISWTLKNGNADQRLIDFAQYLKSNFSKDIFDFAQMESMLKMGWQLCGNVPSGYGVGSSGTVCAAIFDRFAHAASKQTDPQNKKQLLARMEGFYHGQSSGTDPLISLTNRPIVLEAQITKWPVLPQNWSDHLFLLDTNINRVAAPLIRRFLQQLETDQDWQQKIETDWASASNHCINALLDANSVSFENAFQVLNTHQLDLAPWLIPDAIQRIWQGESYMLKICGAGGGGFMLGYTNNWAATQAELSNYTLHKL